MSSHYKRLLFIVALYGALVSCAALAEAQSGVQRASAALSAVESPEEEERAAALQLQRDRQVELPPADPQAAIERVRQSGLMNDYPDGVFHAERGLTRAELAVILDKTFALGTRKPCGSDFVQPMDVPVNHWAMRAIENVLTRCIMSGYREGRFYPNHDMTRAEALAIFAQAYGVYQYDDDTVKAILSNYPDSARIPAWARKAMATSLKSGFVDTPPQQAIRPLAPMSRGDMAYALSQYLKRHDPPAQESQP